MRSPYVSISWGKDSTLLLWLVYRVAGLRLPVVHFASPTPLPDEMAHRASVLAEWDVDYREVPPSRTVAEYIDLMHEIGLPGISRTKAQQDRAVEALKKKRGLATAAEMGADGVIWGVRAEESRGRTWNAKMRGALYLHADGLWRCSPLIWMKGVDLWQIIDHCEIPYSPIYDKTLFCPRETLRSGGWLTLDGAADRGRVAWLRYYYPEIFNRLAQEFPEVRSYA